MCKETFCTPCHFALEILQIGSSFILGIDTTQKKLFPWVSRIKFHICSCPFLYTCRSAHMITISRSPESCRFLICGCRLLFDKLRISLRGIFVSVTYLCPEMLAATHLLTFLVVFFVHCLHHPNHQFGYTKPCSTRTFRWGMLNVSFSKYTLLLRSGYLHMKQKDWCCPPMLCSWPKSRHSEHRNTTTCNFFFNL